MATVHKRGSNQRRSAAKHPAQDVGDLSDLKAPRSTKALKPLLRQLGISPSAIQTLAKADRRTLAPLAVLLQSEKVTRRQTAEISKLINKRKQPLRRSGIESLARLSLSPSLRIGDMETIIELVSNRKLDRSGLRMLDQLVAHGREHATTVMAVLQDVNSTSPGLEQQAIKLLSQHRGRFAILHEFLGEMDTYDIFRAARRAQILIPTESIIKAHHKHKGKKGGKAKSEKMPEKVRTASGHMATTSRVFYIYNELEPARGIFCAEMATAHLIETIRAKQDAGHSPEKRRSSRRKRAQAQFADFSLQDVLADRSLVSEIGSPLVARKLRLFEQLETECKRLREEVGSHLQGKALTDAAALLNRMQLQDDPGGQLLTWVQRQDEVPEAIQAAFENLYNNHTDLTVSEEQMLWKALALFQTHRSFVTARITVDPFLQDIKEWEKLPADHPLRCGFPNLKDLKPQLAKLAKQEVISRARLGTLLQTTGLYEFRIAANGALWASYSTEVERTVERFRCLFMQDEKWREDCVSLTIPDRTKEGLYGAALGYQDQRQQKREASKQPVLSMRDFRHLMMMTLTCDATSNIRHLFRSTPIADFRQRVLGVVTAGRKADFLDMQLARHDLERRQQKLPKIRIKNREKIGTALDDWNPILLVGNKAPVETLVPQLKLSLSVSEILQRADARSDILGAVIADWRRQRTHMQRQIEVALYTPGQDEGLVRQLHRRVAKLVSSTEGMIANQLKKARRVAASPLVTAISDKLPSDAEQAKYLTTQEVKALERVAAAADALSSLGLGATTANRALAARLEHFRSASFLEGGQQGKLLTLQAAPHADIVPKPKPYRSAFVYRNPQTLRAQLDILEKQIASGDLIATDSLSADWLKRAKAVCLGKQEQALQEHGLRVNVSTVRAARQLVRSPNMYVNRELVELVDQVLPANK